MTDGRLIVARVDRVVADRIFDRIEAPCPKCRTIRQRCPECLKWWCPRCEPIPSDPCDDPTHVDELEAL